MILQERLIDGTSYSKADVEKDISVAEFLHKPLSEINQKYRNLFGNYALFNGKKVPIDFSRKNLNDIIDHRIDFGEYSDLDNSDNMSYFVQLDGTDIYVGFLSFRLSPRKQLLIDEVVLFSFDAENHIYNSQIYKDFEKKLQEFISQGYTITWSCLRENHASVNYKSIVQRLGGRVVQRDEEFVYEVGGGNENTQ